VGGSELCTRVYTRVLVSVSFRSVCGREEAGGRVAPLRPHLVGDGCLAAMGALWVRSPRQPPPPPPLSPLSPLSPLPPQSPRGVVRSELETAVTSFARRSSDRLSKLVVEWETSHGRSHRWAVKRRRQPGRQTREAGAVLGRGQPRAAAYSGVGTIVNIARRFA
jgi:hypothetical protein